MVVLEGSQMATTTLGGPYAQGAPALKIVQKRFLGLHQWLSPVYSKEIKEQLVSVTNYFSDRKWMKKSVLCRAKQALITDH